MIGRGAPSSCLADDQVLLCGSDRAEVIDVEDALDLGKQALEEAEVSARNPGDRGDRLRIGEVGRVESEAQLLPLVLQNEP